MSKQTLGCAGGVVLGLIVLALLIQLIPYGQNHSDPPVLAEPQWDNPQTRALAVRACFDCHSNQTVWPWYTNVAPFSWLIQRDVDRGRQRLNFSNWTGRVREVGEVSRTIDRGDMPPWYYVVLHPSAGLSSQEKAQLIQGLNVTLSR